MSNFVVPYYNNGKEFHLWPFVIHIMMIVKNECPVLIWQGNLVRFGAQGRKICLYFKENEKKCLFPSDSKQKNQINIFRDFFTLFILFFAHNKPLLSMWLDQKCFGECHQVRVACRNWKWNLNLAIVIFFSNIFLQPDEGEIVFCFQLLCKSDI